MSNRKGMHFANEIPFDKQEELWAIGCDSFVLLHDQRNWIPEIKRRNAGRKVKIVIRAYLPNWYTKNAAEWARECAVWWKADVAPFIDVNCEIWLTPANEMNLRDEGHPLAMSYGYLKWQRLEWLFPVATFLVNRVPKFRERARSVFKSIHPRDASVTQRATLAVVNYPPRSVYEDIRDWCSLFAKTIKPLVPGIGLIFPALSWGHSDDQNDAGYVGNDIIAPVVKEDYDNNIGAHIYWNNQSNRQSKWYGRRHEITHAAHPEWVMWCTEMGANESLASDDAEDYKLAMDELPEYIHETFSPAWFIYQGAGGMVGWSINKKPRIMQMLKDYKAPSAPTKKYITDAEAAKIIRKYGFTDKFTALRVGMAESCKSGSAPIEVTAYNPKAPDNSYGWFQINMIGDLGVARRKQFGLQSNEELFDADTCARAAFAISSGGTNWQPWGTYTQGTYRLFDERAQRALGDGFEEKVIAREAKLPRLYNPNTGIFRDAQTKGQGFPVTDEYPLDDTKRVIVQGYARVVKTYDTVTRQIRDVRKGE
jgi:hypothetical protein